MALPHSTDGGTETQSLEGDGSVAKSRELVLGQMSALTTHFRISSTSGAYGGD